MYTIYGVNLVGKTDIIYVGCTGRPLKDRLEGLKSSNRVLRHLGSMLEIKPLLKVPKLGRFKREREVISKYRSIGQCQANIHTRVSGRKTAKELAGTTILPIRKRRNFSEGWSNGKVFPYSRKIIAYDRDGNIDNDQSGKNARFAMLAHRIKNKTVASRMGIQASFFSELLTNKRVWSKPMEKRFLKAIKSKAAQ